jgi:hypothetical protein
MRLGRVEREAYLLVVTAILLVFEGTSAAPAAARHRLTSPSGALSEKFLLLAAVLPPL